MTLDLTSGDVISWALKSLLLPNGIPTRKLPVTRSENSTGEAQDEGQTRIRIPRLPCDSVLVTRPDRPRQRPGRTAGPRWRAVCDLKPGFDKPLQRPAHDSD